MRHDIFDSSLRRYHLRLLDRHGVLDQQGRQSDFICATECWIGVNSAVRESRDRIRPSTSPQVLSKVLAVKHIFNTAARRLLDTFLSGATSLILYCMLAGRDARDHDGGRLAERLVQIGDEVVDTCGRLPARLPETAFAMNVAAMFPIYDALQLIVVQIRRLLAVVIAHEGVKRLILIDVAQMLIRIPSGTGGAVGLRRETCRLNASPIVPQLIDQIGGDRYFILTIGRMDAQLSRSQRHGIVHLRLLSFIIAAGGCLLISVGRVVLLLGCLVILCAVKTLPKSNFLMLLLITFAPLLIHNFDRYFM